MSKALSTKETERLKNKIEYQFVVGVDLFSRYAFVKFFRIIPKGSNLKPKNIDVLKEDNLRVIDEEPVEIAEKDGYEADKEDDGLVTGLKSEFILKAFQEWYKRIYDMGFDHVYSVYTDDGTEFQKEVTKFITKNDSIHGITVPNDRVKNPIAERFIQTFKRLFGQYCALKGTFNITDNDAQKIVDFYNRRVHSSTGYAPIDVLDGISMKDFNIKIKDENAVAPLLFEYYRNQKNTMYYYLKDSLPVGSIVRIYTKWLTYDDNKGDYKSNNPNWSYTLYKVLSYNKKDNAYPLAIYQKYDKRDFKTKEPGKRGLRREFLLPINYELYQKYNLKN